MITIHPKRLTGFLKPTLLAPLLAASLGAVLPLPASAATTGLWVTPLELDFGPVGVGATSPQAVVTITNYSAGILNGFSGGAPGAPFTATQDCAAGVAPGEQCHYYIRFSPTAEGDFSATSYSGSSLGNFSIRMRGRGVGAKVVHDAHSLDLGSVTAGGSATQQVVTLRNVGLAPLKDFAGGGVYLPFVASQDCNIAGGILPGNSCRYYFDFNPTESGSFSATSSSSTNGGAVSVALQGTGRSLFFGGGQRVSPRSLDFGPVGVGTASAQLKAEIRNQRITLIGDPVSITGFTGGGVPAPFSATQDCADGVPQGESCYFYYRFTPTAAGEFTATSSVSDSFGPFSIQLHGTGVAPAQSATPLWLDFGPVQLNSTSPTQTVTITNTGLSPIDGWAGGGVGAPFSAYQDCAGTPLQPGQSCHFTYSFTPTATGFFTAVSSFSTNAGSVTVRLQGGMHPTEYRLGITIAGEGSGNVASSPAGLSCGSSCSGMFPAGAPVTLTAAAAEFSLFGGWSGICTGTGDCAVMADADKQVTATFMRDSAYSTRIGTSSYFGTLTKAYQAAAPDSATTIKAWATHFTENLTCGDPKQITLAGGFSTDYSSNSGGHTLLHGILTLARGSLTVEGLVIR